MDMNDQLNQYRTDAINTASPEQLTLMLYRAALVNVQNLRKLMNEGPVNGLDKSQLARDIFASLADTVNLEHPHGQTMKDLYLYCWRTILSAAIEGSPEALGPVQEVIQNLIQGLEGYANRHKVPQRSEDVAVSINFAG